MYKVATGTFRDLNKGFVNQNYCMGLPNGTYWLPEPCVVARQVYDGGIEPFELIGPNGPYNNISYTQFIKWNAAAVHSRVMPGDYICIGPPGGAYIADLAPGGQGGPPVYTTTAQPALQTPPGTVSNCGKYYDTVSGDARGAVAMNFSITFPQLREYNPQLDDDCTNLWANASYCVATVRSGSTNTRPPLTSTLLQSTKQPLKTSSVATPTETESQHVSKDGQCGSAGKVTCSDSGFGDCCSVAGWCGSGAAHCGTGCQTDLVVCSGTTPTDNVSTDGTCGGDGGSACTGSGFGSCCSVAGWCGTSAGHCGLDCQPAFGTCDDTSDGDAEVSPDGTCGAANGFTCVGSGVGDCCSVAGWCGASTAHCGDGCQPGYGTCSPSLSESSWRASYIQYGKRSDNTLALLTRCSFKQRIPQQLAPRNDPNVKGRPPTSAYLLRQTAVA
jgi:hypothetical protein